MGGVAKTLWVLFVIVIPYLGVFIYLIARGSKMQEHAVKDAATREAATRQYVQSVAGTRARLTRSPDSRTSRLRARSRTLSSRPARPRRSAADS